MSNQATIFKVSDPLVEILRLDARGMTYRGVLIEDAGEAHRAFLEVMALQREAMRQLETPPGASTADYADLISFRDALEQIADDEVMDDFQLRALARAALGQPS